MSLSRRQHRLAAAAALGLIDGSTTVTVHQRAVYADEIHIDDDCAAQYQVTRQQQVTVTDLPHRYPTKLLCEKCIEAHLDRAMPWATTTDRTRLGPLTDLYDTVHHRPEPGRLGSLRQALTYTYGACSPRLRAAAVALTDQAADIEHGERDHPGRTLAVAWARSRFAGRAATMLIERKLLHPTSGWPTWARQQLLDLVPDPVRNQLEATQTVTLDLPEYDDVRDRLTLALAGDLVWVSPTAPTKMLCELAEDFDVQHPRVLRVPRLAAAVSSAAGDPVTLLTESGEVTAAELDQALRLRRDDQVDLMSIVAALRAAAA